VAVGRSPGPQKFMGTEIKHNDCYQCGDKQRTESTGSLFNGDWRLGSLPSCRMGSYLRNFRFSRLVWM
jgi:hypothetical protein